MTRVPAPWRCQPSPVLSIASRFETGSGSGVARASLFLAQYRAVKGQGSGVEDVDGLVLLAIDSTEGHGEHPWRGARFRPLDENAEKDADRHHRRDSSYMRSFHRASFRGYALVISSWRRRLYESYAYSSQDRLAHVAASSPPFGDNRRWDRYDEAFFYGDPVDLRDPLTTTLQPDEGPGVKG